jgi:hypothetical protein
MVCTFKSPEFWQREISDLQRRKNHNWNYGGMITKSTAEQML